MSSEHFPTTEQHLTLSLDNLLAVFSNRDKAARKAAIERTYHPSIICYEPGGKQDVGYEEISARVDELLSMGDGTFEFEAVEPFHVNHGLATLPWQFGKKGEKPAMKGVDINLVEDGKISKCWVMIEGSPSETALPKN